MIFGNRPDNKTDVKAEQKATPLDLLSDQIREMQYSDLLKFGQELLSVALKMKDESTNSASSWAHFIFNWAQHHEESKNEANTTVYSNSKQSLLLESEDKPWTNVSSLSERPKDRFISS